MKSRDDHWKTSHDHASRACRREQMPTKRKGQKPQRRERRGTLSIAGEKGSEPSNLSQCKMFQSARFARQKPGVVSRIFAPTDVDAGIVQPLQAAPFEPPTRIGQGLAKS